MMLHLKVLNLGEQDRLVACILYYMNLTILCVFIVELAFKVVTYGMTTFKHRMDVVDFFIVLLCFSLSLTIGGCDRSVNSAGLLIAFRLWRISHMVSSVKQEFDRKMVKEERMRTALEREVCKLRDYCVNQEYELQMYRLLLQQNHIALPTVLRMPRTPNTLNVIAEVNDADSSSKLESPPRGQ
ncbi:unnamed protein product [Soboliphyme baturini]|uniref:Voltage-gated hydrogen channel 1 n=1 Tax=Soboliphyme baturini TaxID=241478 RepID=A0A183JA41_9BILA|nr:unnamed protein product [Soboliphyme baturini]